MATFKTLDTLLTCPICKSIFNTPVSLPCTHTFCSLCVRTHILAQKNCPQCRVVANETMLRKETVLAQVAEEWDTRTRAEIEKMVEERDGHRGGTRTVERGENKETTSGVARHDTETNKEEPRKSNRNSQRRIELDPTIITPPKKRKKSRDNSPDLVEQPLKKSYHPTDQLSPIETANIYTVDDSEDLDGDELRFEDDDDYTAPEEASVLANNSGTTTKCPVCSRAIEGDNLALNRHIDLCLNGTTINIDMTPPKPKPKSTKMSNQNQSPSRVKGTKAPTSEVSAFTAEPNRRRCLGKLWMSGMKDQALKAELSRYNLSTSGSRKDMEARMSQWHLIWNSACDEVSEVPDYVLQRRLLQWENSLRGATGIRSSSNAHSGPILKTETDVRKFAYEQKSEFQRLIEDVKRRNLEAKIAQEKSRRSEEENVQNTEGENQIMDNAEDQKRASSIANARKEEAAEFHSHSPALEATPLEETRISTRPRSKS